ncbi:MAG: response regulator transcription factor [Chloroflexi bacterium]|nr:response regulator transcription factor [Chloroflexota bacterium]
MRVVIGEDSVLLREGIARLLGERQIEVVGQAGDLVSLLATVAEAHPDAVVVDIRMPPTFTDEGLRAVEAIRASRGKSIGVLVLSQHLDARFALTLVANAAGGLGYLMKERIADVDDFVDALRRVARGGSIVDPDIVRELLAIRERDIIGTLTGRERDVLMLMAEGRTNAAICERLAIGLKTVEAHVNTIFSKLGLEPAADDNRRVLAVLAYLRMSSRLE